MGKCNTCEAMAAGKEKLLNAMKEIAACWNGSYNEKDLQTAMFFCIRTAQQAIKEASKNE